MRPTLCNTASERSSSRAIRGKLRQLNLFSLERRRLRADLTLAFKMFKGEIDFNLPDFFLCPPRAGLRGHTYRLLQEPSRLRHMSGAFSVRVVKYWNRLPAPLALSPSVSIFKKQLNHQWFEIFSAAPMRILFPFINIFLYIVTPDDVCFPYPQTLFSKCGYFWPSWSILPLINKIDK